MKKSVVGVYSDHNQAVAAVQKLISNQLSKKDITIVGRMEDVNGDMHLTAHKDSPHATPLAVGSAVGIVTGILTGIGIFAIPGLGFLYGAGALVGAIAGFDFGVIAGGLVTISESLADDEHKHKLSEYLEHHHHLVVYTGNDKDKAEELLKGTNPEEVFH